MTPPMPRPFRQGRLDPRRRAVMPPVADRLGSEDGTVAARLRAFEIPRVALGDRGGSCRVVNIVHEAAPAAMSL